jgi:hypothetical protein
VVGQHVVGQAAVELVELGFRLSYGHELDAGAADCQNLRFASEAAIRLGWVLG